MPADTNVVRRISEYNCGLSSIHELSVTKLQGGICAQNAVFTEQPQVAVLCHRRAAVFGWDLVGGIFRIVGRRIKTFDHYVDLAHLKAGNLETEVQLDFGERLELLR